MGVNKSYKIASIFFLLVAMIFIVILSFCGIIIFSFPPIPAIVTGALIVILFILNAAITVPKKKKLAEQAPKYLFDIGERYKEQIEKDYAAAEKNVKRHISFGYIYCTFLTVLIVANFFFSINISFVSTEIPEVLIRIGIFAVYVLLAAIVFWIPVYLLIAPTSKNKPKEETRLHNNDYPLISGIVMKAAAKLGCKKKIQLNLVYEGFSVFQLRNYVYINIDATMLSLLTKEEFYNVMLHEIAHVANKDTVRAEKLLGSEQKWTSLNGTLTTLAVGYFAYKIFIESEMYLAVSSRHHEMLADEAIKKFGDPQTHVNALAKSAMFALFMDYPVRELSYDLYESEEPCPDVAERTLAAFRKYLGIFEEKWNGVLRHELPARVNSHPTFRQRMEMMGVENYDYTRTETDEAFNAECEKVRRASNALLAKYKDEYANMRKENYLEIKEKFEEYSAATAAGRPLSESALLDYARCFYPLDHELAERIVDKVLAKSPDSAYANFQKGLMLSYLYDDRCVGYFKTAAKHYLLTDAAMQCLGVFALKSGNQELLDEYRADVVDAAQNAYELERTSAVKQNDTLTENVLPPETLNEIVVDIVKIGKGCFRKIYTAAKYHKNGDKIAVFLIESEPQTRPDLLYVIFQETYNYLLRRAENCAYELYADRAPAAITNKIKTVTNALIYDKYAYGQTVTAGSVFDELN